jgi:hypothetical protein
VDKERTVHAIAAELTVPERVLLFYQITEQGVHLLGRCSRAGATVVSADGLTANDFACRPSLFWTFCPEIRSW